MLWLIQETFCVWFGSVPLWGAVRVGDGFQTFHFDSRAILEAYIHAIINV